jgi:hypothetical protein
MPPRSLLIRGQRKNPAQDFFRFWDFPHPAFHYCHVSLCEVIRVRNLAFSDNNRMLTAGNASPINVVQGCFGVG